MTTARIDIAGIVEDGKNLKQVVDIDDTEIDSVISCLSDCLPSLWIKDPSSENGLLRGRCSSSLHLENAVIC